MLPFRTPNQDPIFDLLKDGHLGKERKIDPEFFDFILDVLIDPIVMFLNKGLWKTAMKVLVKQPDV